MPVLVAPPAAGVFVPVLMFSLVFTSFSYFLSLLSFHDSLIKKLKHDNLQPREWRGVLTFPNVVRRSNVTEYYSSLELID